MLIIPELLDPPESAIRNQMRVRRSLIFACQALSFVSRGPIMISDADKTSCHVTLAYLWLYDRN